MSTSLENVVGQLEEDIVFGRRRPRERLVEEDLVSQFGAKKHVIRQALVDLERMGLVERISGTDGSELFRPDLEKIRSWVEDKLVESTSDTEGAVSAHCPIPPPR